MTAPTTEPGLSRKAMLVSVTIGILGAYAIHWLMFRGEPYDLGPVDQLSGVFIYAVVDWFFNVRKRP